MTADSGPSKGCPYFLRDLQACDLHEDGIYIPPRAHSITYCLTDVYPDCDTYKLFLPQAQKKFQSPEKFAGRRRYLRISEKRQICIRTFNSRGELAGDFIEPAFTIDYSKAGMRILVHGKIPTKTPLFICFEEAFHIPGFHGIARICWTRKLKSSPEIMEAGLFFTDDYLQDILSAETQN